MLVDTLKILETHGLRLDKRKGQNYLVNPHIIAKILEFADISSKDTILEIGAGIGNLTIPLAENADKIFAVEKDKKIAAALQERLKDLDVSNVEILVGDAVKLSIPDFNKVVSNLPYQISSPITFKLLKEDFDFGILMYQKEFAQRMVAGPGDSNYSRLSVMLHFCADIKLLFQVPPTAFLPKPKVSSSVIKLIPRRNDEVDEILIKVTRALFQHKRKKVRNALNDSFHEITTLNKKDFKDIILQLEPVLMDKRVFKLKGEEIMKISLELKKYDI